MTKSLATALALAAFVAIPAIMPAQAASSSTDTKIAQSTTTPQDCSKIKDAQMRAECLKKQGTGK
jgi:TRAP-type C4-dicarboxylate transport system substrate-binding protein